MPTPSNFMGVGTPAPLASLLGYEPSAVTCAGTAAGDATPITTKLSQLTAASSQTGAILPSDALNGDIFIVNTVSSTSAVVYPPSGATINAASSLTVAQNKTALLVKYSATLWFSILTA